MDDDGGLGIRNWGYYEQQHLKGNLGLRLMSTESDMTKTFLSNGGFLHRNCSLPETSIPMEFARDGWIHHSRDNKLLVHAMPLNHHPSYSLLPPDHHGTPTLQMMQPTDPPKDKDPPPMENPKKRSQGRPNKPSKPKKPKKVAAQREETADYLVSQGKDGAKCTGLVINGIGLDLSEIPTPVCSCTGPPQQCYRWGIGGWQSACCTTNMSEYPLPMSMKKRGARIAGRKMSQGAFKKVLEKLAGEGYNLSNPIDLKTFWAKHGTNKFVTIR